MVSDAEANSAARAFRKNLQFHLRRYDPREFLQVVAQLLNGVNSNPRDLMARFPPHFLLHSMEAVCAYHGIGRTKGATGPALERLWNLYKAYDDPVTLRPLQEKAEQKNPHGLELALAMMARDQFFVQGRPARSDFARGVILFLDNPFPQTQCLFQAKYGLTFEDWMHFCLGIALTAEKVAPSAVITGSCLDGVPGLVPMNTIRTCFKLASRSISEVGGDYKESRKGHPLLELHVPNGLEKRPLIRLDEYHFLVSHRPFLLNRSCEGLYDLCQEAELAGPFGTELGKAFQKYVGLVLEQLPGKKQLVTEKTLKQRLPGQKVCDYLVSTPDAVVLVECKATEYSADLVTLEAIARTNSTAKVAGGMVQLCTTAVAVESGLLVDLIGEVNGRSLLGLVVTFRHIFLVNGDLYWDTLRNMRLELPPGVEALDGPFYCRPQVMDVAELERLVLAVRSGATFSSLHQDKLSRGMATTGEWETYLSSKLERKDQMLPMLTTAFDAFEQRLRSKARSNHGDTP